MIGRGGEIAQDVAITELAVVRRNRRNERRAAQSLPDRSP
jgi:hypothetical protein